MKCLHVALDFRCLMEREGTQHSESYRWRSRFFREVNEERPRREIRSERNNEPTHVSLWGSLGDHIRRHVKLEGYQCVTSRSRECCTLAQSVILLFSPLMFKKHTHTRAHIEIPPKIPRGHFSLTNLNWWRRISWINENTIEKVKALFSACWNSYNHAIFKLLI